MSNECACLLFYISCMYLNVYLIKNFKLLYNNSVFVLYNLSLEKKVTGNN